MASASRRVIAVQQAERSDLGERDATLLVALVGVAQFTQ